MVLLYEFGKSGKEYRDSHYARITLSEEALSKIEALKKDIR